MTHWTKILIKICCFPPAIWPFTFPTNSPHRISINEIFSFSYISRFKNRSCWKLPSHFSSKNLFCIFLHESAELSWVMWWKQATTSKRTWNFQFLSLERFQLFDFTGFALKTSCLFIEDSVDFYHPKMWARVDLLQDKNLKLRA